jgi:hypothetical protein
MTTPLQFVDQFLLEYHMGHVFLLLLAGGVLTALVLRSKEVLSLVLLVFGFVFVATPGSMMGTGTTPILFKMFGAALVVLGPLTWTVTTR